MQLPDAFQKYRDIARQKSRYVSPFRLGIAVGEEGADLPSPYTIGTRADSGYRQGVQFGRERAAARAAAIPREQVLRPRFELWAHQQGLSLRRLVSDVRYESMETEWAWRAVMALAEV